MCALEAMRWLARRQPQRKHGRACPLPSKRIKLRRDFTAEIEWLVRKPPLGVGGQDPGPGLDAGGHDPALSASGSVRAVLSSLQVFYGEHGSWPSRRDQRPGADSLARKAAGVQKLWAQVTEEDRGQLRATFADAVAWLLREDRRNAVIATLTEGIAFRRQYGPHACRGRASRIPHEDALAQRVARAVLAAQQQEELRSQFGDFLDSWMDADAARDAAQSALQEGTAFRLQHDRFPRRGCEAEFQGEDALAQRIARAVPLAQQQEELRSQFGDFLDSWMNADAALEAAQSALQEGTAFRLQHDRFPRRGCEAEFEGEDALAQRIARAVPLAQQQEELRSQFGDFLDSWMNADAALEAAQSALQEGTAFRLQHDRFPRRGCEAEFEGEDALAQRIARAVPFAQQQEELRSQFGDFLDSWMDADAAADAALEAARCALQEGMAFRLQHDRFPSRGCEADLTARGTQSGRRRPRPRVVGELEGEDALAQRIARAVPLARQQEELRRCRQNATEITQHCWHGSLANLV